MMAMLTKIAILALLILLIVIIIKVGKRVASILIMVLVLAFAWFSFFTDQGAARLSILISGHPIIAYTTHLEKQESISNDNVIYYKSSKPFNRPYAKCNKLWFVRIPVVE